MVAASSCLSSELELEKASRAGRTWGAVPGVPGLTLLPYTFKTTSKAYHWVRSLICMREV